MEQNIKFSLFAGSYKRSATVVSCR